MCFFSVCKQLVYRQSFYNPKTTGDHFRRVLDQFNALWRSFFSFSDFLAFTLLMVKTRNIYAIGDFCYCRFCFYFSLRWFSYNYISRRGAKHSKYSGNLSRHSKLFETFKLISVVCELKLFIFFFFFFYIDSLFKLEFVKNTNERNCRLIGTIFLFNLLKHF